MMKKPRIIISAGEPSGIGPDIVLDVLQSTVKHYDVAVVADPNMLLQRSKVLGYNLTVRLVDLSDSWEGQPNIINVIPIDAPHMVEAGTLAVENAPYVLTTLKTATLACMDGHADAMVTAPLHKGIINDAGIAFTGHTEYLAELTGADWPVMMLATEGLRVCLVTTHMPLAQVASTITPTLIERVMTIVHRELRERMGVSDPHIYVCGLNPHAGEGGYLGREEIEIIEPTLTKLRERHWKITGPLPADTLFSPDNLKEADTVLAMYHDQGLPVLKYKGFGNAINVTLGLPIIRTSVDHGTALALAGTGRASSASLKLAIETAVIMSKNNSQST